MLEIVKMAAPDPILGLTEAFKKDPNPDKINLGVGIYKDAQGRTPILKTVKEAEKRILAGEASKDYLPMSGSPSYTAAVQELIFGAGSETTASKRAVTLQTPGGTGGLRVAGDFLRKNFPDASIWLSEPTWPNHTQVFEAVGMPVKTYPYYNAAANKLDFDKMLAAVETIPNGGVILLHGCCHNPTGADPSPAQWEKIAGCLAVRRIFVLCDLAYQGFGDGLVEDASGAGIMLRHLKEFFIATSYSKNFGLYNERVGALTAVTASAGDAEKVLSQLKIAVRVNYSNPPAHGAAIVSAIIQDKELRRQWETELKEMRDRINGMRHLFADTMNKKAKGRDFSFIKNQRGMFSLLGVSKEQVQALREKYSIYIVGSGRINVAGMNESIMDHLCAAIASVL